MNIYVVSDDKGLTDAELLLKEVQIHSFHDGTLYVKMSKDIRDKIDKYFKNKEQK